jgi:acyl-CoA hydrolase
VHVSELDVALEADTPLLTWAEPTFSDVEARIGKHVAELVRDGDTLQFGIGSVPVALAGPLVAHRRLRIHSGMISPALRRLWEAGAVDRDARITTGVVLGDEAFYDFAARLEPLWLTDVSHTHDVAALAAIPRFVAINGAVEVDLFGQANCERADGAIQAGAGGLPAFAQGALAAPGGRLVVCLRSTARDGAISRIVPTLDARALCTLPRYLADVVVTEHGIAELRGAGLDARAQALIGVAAPEHRPALADAWRELRRRA